MAQSGSFDWKGNLFNGSNHLAKHHLKCLPAEMPERRVSTGLAKLSGLREGGAPRAGDTGLLGVELPNG